LDTHLGRGIYKDEEGQHTKIFLSVGHDEYWSSQQRRNIEEARDQWGLNLGFFSANAVYWNIRWEHGPFDQASDPTKMIVYKESQSSHKLDPNATAWTGTFRDPRSINPEGSRPENALCGGLFAVNAWRNDPLHVPHQYSHHRFWRNTHLSELLRSTNDAKASLFRGILGHEWDEDRDNGFRPVGMSRLSETTQDNVQLLMDYGSTFDTGSATHHLLLYHSVHKPGATTYRTNRCVRVLHQNGNSAHLHDSNVPLTCIDHLTTNTKSNLDRPQALVFGAGTVQWSWALDPHHDTPTQIIPQMENEYSIRVNYDNSGLSPDPNILQATVNLFADMGNVQPQTLLRKTYPGVDFAHPDFDQLPPEVALHEARLLAVRAANRTDAHVPHDLHFVFTGTDDFGILSAVEVQLFHGVRHPAALGRGPGNTARDAADDRFHPADLVDVGRFHHRRRIYVGPSDRVPGDGAPRVLVRGWYRGADDSGNLSDAIFFAVPLAVADADDHCEF